MVYGFMCRWNRRFGFLISNYFQFCFSFCCHIDWLKSQWTVVCFHVKLTKQQHFEYFPENFILTILMAMLSPIFLVNYYMFFMWADIWKYVLNQKMELLLILYVNLSVVSLNIYLHLKIHMYIFIWNKFCIIGWLVFFIWSITFVW